MPVEFANAARAQAHVNARDGRRDMEVVPGDLPGPAAVLDAFGRKAERSPELRHAVDVGGRRVEETGLMASKSGSCGPGSVNASGLVTLTAPSGGRSGLPKPTAARAAAVRAANPPAASIARRERFGLIISLMISTHASNGCFGDSFMT